MYKAPPGQKQWIGLTQLYIQEALSTVTSCSNLCLITPGLNWKALAWPNNKLHNKHHNIAYNLVSIVLLFLSYNRHQHKTCHFLGSAVENKLWYTKRWNGLMFIQGAKIFYQWDTHSFTFKNMKSPHIPKIKTYLSFTI